MSGSPFTINWLIGSSSEMRYGYIKNHKKTEEYKRAKDSKPKSKKVNSQSNLDFQKMSRLVWLEYHTRSDDHSPSSSPVKTRDNLEENKLNLRLLFLQESDPLHHEFADFNSPVTGKCHANQSSVIESLPISPIPVEDSEPVQEEIDIFLVRDDLIPPSVENDDSEDEDNELPNLDHQDDPSIPRPPPEPPDIEKCFEPKAGILITKVFKGVSKPHDFMANILPTLPTLVSDLTFILFLSFGSEDTFLTPTAFLEPAWLSREELSYALMFVQTLMKARLRFSLPFALPKDELIQGLSRRLRINPK
ncbi:hypothetical protein Tco_0776649 [Tanacetum coccineum]